MYIYIVLSYTGSLPAKIIKATTNSKYSHSSLSMDPELLTMFSFGRRYIYFPWYGGFIKEGINKGLFRRMKGSEIAVYRIKINNEEQKKIETKIRQFEGNSKSYVYDYIGLFGVLVNKKLFRENGYVCSSFVAETLEEAGIRTIKESWKVHPEDLAYIDNLELVYEGLAIDYSSK